jgi:hypothetical protein
MDDFQRAFQQSAGFRSYCVTIEIVSPHSQCIPAPRAPQWVRMSGIKRLDRRLWVAHGNSARDRVGHEPAFARNAVWIFGRRSADKL